MKRPKYLIRPSDSEPFVQAADGLYYLYNSIVSWPNHLHMGYEYFTLIDLGFTPAKSIEATNAFDEARFYKNKVEAVAKANATQVERHNEEMKVLRKELAEVKRRLWKRGNRSTCSLPTKLWSP